MKAERRVILSCEHAGNRVPARYHHLFAGNHDVLNTHRGFDIGIAPIARQLHKRLDCPLCLYAYTRLLIDVNRTRKASQFSEFSKVLSDADKQQLIDAYDRPYKNLVKQAVIEQHAYGPVLHWSLHSFTPVLNGQQRNADIGILYDPARSGEAAYAGALQERLRQKTGLRIRRNYPYSGNADGMTTWLRKEFRQKYYMGIEIEFNQAFLASLKPKTRSDFIVQLADIISPPLFVKAT